MFREFELYMMALMPPAELSAQIHQQRQAFASRYGFRRGLKPPVHITLISPFKVPLIQVPTFEATIKSVSDWTKQLSSFPIMLDDFGFFDHPQQKSPVLFINVVKSPELMNLYSIAKQQLSVSPFIRPVLYSSFQPHITLGYRDLNRAAFPAIKADYGTQHFNASFDCNKVFLWKHDAVNWQVLYEFPFAGKT